MPIDPAVLRALKHYWGYDALRPLQAEAIAAGLANRDSLVVLPTGGGKSLCYQIPPIVADRMDVVISPLISLMKDQVDGLRQNGYPAAALHSGLSTDEKQTLRDGMREGKYRLLFVSPERLVDARFIAYLQRCDVRAFAIDEAHCISQWGHDFRPEYRQLAQLKQRFPAASMHAYTATATERVREDIVQQLGLREPTVLVGGFDRPNLVYRVLQASDRHGQALEIVRRHANEACIVYCLSRRDTDDMAAFLKANGVKAAAYHAGLAKEERSRVQEAFAAERLDVVAATVAFGMGIDRSNVRCVIHAAMPKSIEHYQQETGRAGRDGLEAECVTLYSFADVRRWERLIAMSAEQSSEPERLIAAQSELLQHMQAYCGSAECRHRALTRYFGQRYERDDCGACDVCLDEVESMPESTVTAKKILSCIYRLGQPYGVKYLTDVLRGSEAAAIKQRGHHELSTHGLLRDMPEKTVQNLIFQLIDQDLIQRSTGDRPVLMLNDASKEVLLGQREVRLIDPGRHTAHASRAASEGWEGVDRDLFDALRAIRRELAEEAGVPAFVIFGDRTLRELAAVRPDSIDALRGISGIGEKKRAAYGEQFIQIIRAHCEAHGVAMNVTGAATVQRPARRAGRTKPVNRQKEQAMQLFAEGASIDEICAATGRAESTIGHYLEDYIRETKPASISPWVDDVTYQRVIDAASTLAAERLAPIHEHLGGDVPYGAIRAALTHYEVMRAEETE